MLFSVCQKLKRCILKFKKKRLAWLRFEAGETEEAKDVRDKRLQFRVRRRLLRFS